MEKFQQINEIVLRMEQLKQKIGSGKKHIEETVLNQNLSLAEKQNTLNQLFDETIQAENDFKIAQESWRKLAGAGTGFTIGRRIGDKWVGSPEEKAAASAGMPQENVNPDELITKKEFKEKSQEAASAAFQDPAFVEQVQEAKGLKHQQRTGAGFTVGHIGADGKWSDK